MDGSQIQKTFGPNWSWVWRACYLWPNTAQAHWKNTRHTCATARGSVGSLRALRSDAAIAAIQEGS